MYSVEEIKENYKSFSDSKIENIAINESKDLRTEVLEILRNEILKRKLDANLITWVNAETNYFTEKETLELAEKIKKIKCPNCGEKNNELKGYEINKVFSFIIFYSRTIERRILCKRCGRNNNIISNLSILLLGWWSRRGFLVTPYCLFKNIINSFSNEKISNNVINEFIKQNNGMFRLHGINEENISNLISLHNNNYEIPETEEEEKLK
ncbi:hypothetical protein QVZ41_13785 [Wenyingzhuangia sp. chi5]|uniref:Transposase n=1 Tax=Wenyingzhuangia gilva TaxID=3057677 RepID=A0ABT8VVB2_9FLAO|nr:hypothetical protein [Wenyingzhuangia sp. chi5]MDO3695917.1 hypothetical protein [Wenyingzhuangia sp. chi5]